MHTHKINTIENKFNFLFALYLLGGIAFTLFLHFDVGLVSIAIVTLLITYKSGIEFDCDNNRYRKYIVLLGYTIGEGWMTLSEMKYITVVRNVRVGETDSGADEYNYQ